MSIENKRSETDAWRLLVWGGFVEQLVSLSLHMSEAMAHTEQVLSSVLEAEKACSSSRRDNLNSCLELARRVERGLVLWRKDEDRRRREEEDERRQEENDEDDRIRQEQWERRREEEEDRRREEEEEDRRREEEERRREEEERCREEEEQTFDD